MLIDVCTYVCVDNAQRPQTNRPSHLIKVPVWTDHRVEKSLVYVWLLFCALFMQNRMNKPPSHHQHGKWRSSSNSH